MVCFRLFVAFAFIFVSTLQSFAQAALLNEGRLQEAEAAHRAQYLNQYAQRFNKGVTVGSMVKQLELYYPQKSDRDYMATFTKQLVKTSLLDKQPKIQVEGERVSITLPNLKIVTVQRMGENLAKVNGRNFRVNMQQPLKKTHLELTKLLRETIYAQTHSPVDLLLPRADAEVLGWALITAGLAMVIVLPVVLDTITLFNLHADLKMTLQACENRDKSVPLNESVLLEKLQSYKEKDVYNLEEQRAVKDCAQWAKRNKDHEYMLKLICDLGQKLVACVEQYKAESAQAVNSPADQGAPTAPKGSEAK